MNPTRLPRLFVFLSLLLILAAFLLGTLLSFTQVQAAPAATPGGTGADEETSPTATLTPEPGRGSANMTGILLLGIVLVMIILFGLLWGGRITHK